MAELLTRSLEELAALAVPLHARSTHHGFCLPRRCTLPFRPRTDMASRPCAHHMVSVFSLRTHIAARADEHAEQARASFLVDAFAARSDLLCSRALANTRCLYLHCIISCTPLRPTIDAAFSIHTSVSAHPCPNAVICQEAKD